MLLHGFPLDHAMWDAQIAELQTHFRVIAPDLRGFGASQLADGDAEDGVGMERYAADVIGAARLAAGERAGRARGLFDGRLHGLAGRPPLARAAPRPHPVRHAGRGRRRRAAGRAGSKWPRRRCKRAIPRRRWRCFPSCSAPRRASNGPKSKPQVRAMIERQSAEAIAAAQRGMARREDVRGKLDAITADSLCIVGVEDVDQPAGGNARDRRAAGEVRPRRRALVEIDHAGHMTPMENPAAVTAAIAAFAQEVLRAVGTADESLSGANEC